MGAACEVRSTTACTSCACGLEFAGPGKHDELHENCDKANKLSFIAPAVAGESCGCALDTTELQNGQQLLLQ